MAEIPDQAGAQADCTAAFNDPGVDPASLQPQAAVDAVAAMAQATWDNCKPGK